MGKRVNNLVAHSVELRQEQICRGLRASGGTSESLCLGWGQGRLPGGGDPRGQHGRAEEGSKFPGEDCGVPWPPLGPQARQEGVGWARPAAPRTGCPLPESGAAGAGRWAARAESPVLMAAPSLAENSTLWGGGPGAAGVAVLTSLNRWRGALGQGGVPVPEGRRALSEPLHRAAVSVRPSVCPLGAGMPVLGPSLPRWLRWWEGASPSSAGGSQGPEGPV